MKEKHVSILGEDWTVATECSQEDFPSLSKCTGYTEFSIRTIFVQSAEELKKDFEAPLRVIRETIRHEVIHAFLYESGLDCNSGGTDHWARNEEMIDWMAIQGPKIAAAWEALDVMA